jgi:predicted helicase
MQLFLISGGIENNAYNKKRIRKKNWLKDVGVDIVKYDKILKKYIFIQCKNHSQSLNINKLAGYFFTMSQEKHKNKTWYDFCIN